MTTATLPDSRPAPTSSGDDDADHYYCCDPDIAMCGADLSDVPEGFEFDELCRYCAYIDRERLACTVNGCTG